MRNLFCFYDAFCCSLCSSFTPFWSILSLVLLFFWRAWKKEISKSMREGMCLPFVNQLQPKGTEEEKKETRTSPRLGFNHYVLWWLFVKVIHHFNYTNCNVHLLSYQKLEPSKNLISVCCLKALNIKYFYCDTPKNFYHSTSPTNFTFIAISFQLSSSKPEKRRKNFSQFILCHA